MSNNPFRNRIGSQISPVEPSRAISTNPFLDASEMSNNAAVENNKTATSTTNHVDQTTNALVRTYFGHKDDEHVLTNDRLP